MIVVHSKWTLVVVPRLNKRQPVCVRRGGESPGGSCRIFRIEFYQGWKALPGLNAGVEMFAGTTNEINGNTAVSAWKHSQDD